MRIRLSGGSRSMENEHMREVRIALVLYGGENRNEGKKEN
jgi:hypothetical protein